MDLLTVREVSKMLRVTPETVRRWLKEGQLRGVRVGAGWRIERREVLEFVKNGGDKK